MANISTLSRRQFQLHLDSKEWLYRSVRKLVRQEQEWDVEKSYIGEKKGFKYEILFERVPREGWRPAADQQAYELLRGNNIGK
jgi:hypothetical protein